MTILVDECRWPHRGRLWCHLVSDADFDELHAFARRVGSPRVAFQGDHYDLDEPRRQRAIELGAQPVDSRRVVRALDTAGLRRGPAIRRRGLEGIAHLPAPTLTTDRLVLRQWRTDDLAAIAAFDADPDVMRFLGPPLSPAESAAQTVDEAMRLALYGYGKWAVALRGSDELIGRVGLGVTFDLPFGPAVEMGWRLGAAHRGLGFATEAATAAMRYGFDVLDTDTIVAFTSIRNVASQRVMQRLGMSRSSDDDFDHPGRRVHDPDRPQVLYRIERRRPAG